MVLFFLRWSVAHHKSICCYWDLTIILFTNLVWLLMHVKAGEPHIFKRNAFMIIIFIASIFTPPISAGNFPFQTSAPNCHQGPRWRGSEQAKNKPPLNDGDTPCHVNRRNEEYYTDLKQRAAHAPIKTGQKKNEKTALNSTLINWAEPLDLIWMAPTQYSMTTATVVLLPSPYQLWNRSKVECSFVSLFKCV